jgi:DNA-binding PadR family transcriptional regulator
MFGHLILGLLRDGRARHGYELISDYRARSGLPINTGNFYRECSKLSAQGLIVAARTPPPADSRRIPYRITADGCREFDGWLLEPSRQDGPLDGWLLFAEMLSAEDCRRLLDRIQEDLWLENKSLARARADALARAHRSGNDQYQPLAFILLRRIKQTAADLEFIEELRQEFDRLPRKPMSLMVSSEVKAKSG